jgi:hypothetical protein
MRNGKWMAGFAVAAFCVAGCEESSYEDYSKAPLSETAAHDHDHGEHEGKHGGHVLELDDAHGHHAEMVFDKATRDITLYFYGSEIGVAKTATSLEFELEKGEDEVELESKASPLDGETPEACSRFVIAGSQLPEEIKSEEQLDGHFHVTIDGKELVGSFHAHSHDEHGHAQDDPHAKDEHAHEGEKATGEKSGDAAHGDEKTSPDAAPAEEAKPAAAEEAPKAN